jgi:hypothetical protein
MTRRIAARIGIGWAYVAGCLVFTAPLMLVPLARSPLVLELLFTAEFASGFGVMMLDISIGAIFAAVIRDALRSRVTGAFQAVKYGTRPLGALVGGLLGATLGIPARRCGSPPPAGWPRRCSCCPRRCPGSRCRIRPADLPGAGSGQGLRPTAPHIWARAAQSLTEAGRHSGTRTRPGSSRSSPA